MGVALDTGQIVIPGVLALGGGYYGARWQMNREVDAEFRAVVRDAIRSLQAVNQAMVGARSHYIQESVRTTPAGYTALGELEARVADAEEVRDRLLVWTEANSPLPVHFLNALLAMGRANSQMRTAAIWAAADEMSFNTADAWEKIEAGVQGFDDERSEFLQAAQVRIGPRATFWKRAWKCVKPGPGKNDDDPGPSIDSTR